MKRFLYPYLLFCLAGLGSLLCFIEIFPSPTGDFPLFLLCFLLPVPFVLLYLTKCKMWGSIPLLLLAVFCWIKRRDFSLQLYLMFQNIKKILGELYGPVPSSFSGGSEGSWEYAFLLYILVFFLCLFLALHKKRKAVFLCLFLLAVIPGYVLDLPPSRTALGFFLAAFFLWDVAVCPKLSFRQWLPKTCLLLAAYGFCAWILTPALSPFLFQNSQKLHSFVNQTGSRLFADNTSSSAGNLSKDPKTRAFTYETVKNSQTISNIAPVYTGEPVFHFSTDQLLQENFYLRGFIGQDYKNPSWSSPDKDQWYRYAAQNGLSREEARKIYDLPYRLGRSSDTYAYSLEFYFSPVFSYLPYGSELPQGSVGEDNIFQAQSTGQINCFPLTLSTASRLADQAGADLGRLSDLYQDFCQDHYTSWDPQEMAMIQAELEKLPVYSSMPEDPEIEDIRKAATEIQSFLWDHAVYSLSMETPPKTLSRLADFLYRQKKGFCVHFATAGTLLFRMYGIPARYVSGYAFPASLLEEDPMGYHSGDIPDSTAHAWTEIYIPSVGWVPVEVTPSDRDPGLSADRSSQDTDSSQTIPETEHLEEQEAPAKDKGASAPEKENAEKSSALSSVFPFLLAFLRCLLSVLLAMSFLAAVLLIRQDLLFRKHLGYLASGPRGAYLCIFKNLTKLFQLSYPIDGKGLGDQEFYRTLTEKLPPEKRDSFSALYLKARAVAFGPKAPSAKDIRSLRRHYLSARKEFLSCQTPILRLYYRFIRGI